MRHKYWAHFDLAYDGGGEAYSRYYYSKIGMKFSIFWRRNVSSWGGTAEEFKVETVSVMFAKRKSLWCFFGLHRWALTADGKTEYCLDCEYVGPVPGTEQSDKENK